MKGRVIRWAAFFLLVSASAAAAAEPELVNEKFLFKADRAAEFFEAFVPFPSMRLSPDGRYLLYYREDPVPLAPEPDEGPQKATAQRVSVRDLVTGDEQVLSIPASFLLPSYDPLITCNSIDPASGRLVACSGIDVDSNGVLAEHGDKTQVVLYDLESKKATPLDIKGQGIYPMFDRTGERLVLFIGEGPDDLRTPGLYITPLVRVSLKRLSFDAPEAFPLSVCPTADVVAVWVPPAGHHATQSTIVLFDLKANRKTDEITVRTPLWPLLMWSASGRFMYYCHTSIGFEPAGPEEGAVTHVWDRTTSREVVTLKNAVPVGPGPSPTTMVLAAKTGEYRWGKMLLHDGASGKTWTLGESLGTILCAQGKHVVYARKARAGRYQVHTAEIAMPDAKE